MTKPNYIKFIEKKTETFFSFMQVSETILVDKIDEKKLQIVYVSSDYDSDTPVTLEKIYRTNHGFYLFIVRNRLNKVEGTMNVYYEPSQHNELLFYLKAFIKTIKK